MKLCLAWAMLACSFIAMAWLPQACAECCLSDEYTGACRDGRLPEAYYCGARGDGACNVFGCNCQGGCIPVAGEEAKRSGGPDGAALGGVGGQPGAAAASGSSEELSKSAEEATESPARDIFRTADIDQNGWLDEEEVSLYFRRQGLEVDDHAWEGMDADKDGKLSPREVDCDLVKYQAR